MSQKKTLDYIRRNYDRLQLVVPIGAREQIQKKAQEQGKSLNRYIMEAVEKESGLKLTLDNALPWIKK